MFCDIDPVTLDLDPAAAGAAVGERTGGLLPVDILGYPAAMPELERIAAERGLGHARGRVRGRSAPSTPRASVSARAGNLATFAFYANKQLTTGEGGMIVPSSPEIAARLRSERNQGRAPDMGWLAHERLGFNYRLTDLQAAIGVAQLERAERAARRARPRGRPCTRERLEAIGGSAGGRRRPRWTRAAVSPTAAPSGAAGSSTRSCCPPGADRDAWSPSSPGRGSRRRPTCRASTSCPTIASASASREGQFPVAEDASARLLALPFFGAMGEEQVERVCARAEALGRRR